MYCIIKQQKFKENYRLFKTSSIQLAANILSIIFNFFSLPLTINILGLKTFGNMVLIQVLAGIVSSLFVLQTWQSVMLIGNEKGITKQQSAFLYNYSFLVEILSALFATFLVYPISRITGFGFEFGGCCQIYAIAGYLILTQLQVLPCALRISGIFNQYLFSNIFVGIFRIIILITPININAINRVAFAFLGPEIIKQVYMYILIPKWQGCEKHPDVTLFKKCKFRSTMLWSTMARWIDIPIQQFDRLFVNNLLGVQIVGVYQVFKKFGQLVSSLMSPFYNSLFHEYSVFSATGDSKKAYFMQKKAIKWLLLLGFICLFVIEIGCFIFWDKIFPKVDFLPFELSIYIIMIIIANSFSGTYPLIITIGEIKYATINAIIENILFLIFAISVIKHFGLIGLICLNIILYIGYYIANFIKIKKIVYGL